MSNVKAVINGIVVTEASQGPATLILSAGKISAILDPETDPKALYPDCEIIDAAGQYVVPGGVDGHVHFGAFSATPQADDFATGSRAALVGGTTTVVDFAQPNPGETPIEAIRRYKAMGDNSMVDFTFHLTLTEDYLKELPMLDQVAEEGITSFKCYTYYPHITLKPGDFRAVMEKIHDRGVLLVHAEEKSIIDNMKEQYPPKEGEYLPLSLTRPGISEQVAVEELLAIAKETDTDLCIAHTSAHQTIPIKQREAAAGNKKFHLETCPHYAMFTREKLKGENGALFTMNPPLRGQEDADALMQAIVNEDIDFVSTDHCVYSVFYKTDHTSYATVPCGVDGVQMRLPFVFSEGVLKRGLSMQAFVRLTATNAAKFYNLYPRKGTIAVGSDADLVFLDPDAPEEIYTKEKIAGATDYTIFEGVPFAGRVTCTIKGGEVAMKDGKVLAEEGSGKFVFTKV